MHCSFRALVYAPLSGATADSGILMHILCDIDLHAAQTTTGNPKRHTPRGRGGPRARTNNTERKHTSKAKSSRRRQEAPNTHRSGGNNAAMQRLVTNSPQYTQTKSMRLHPDTRERNSKSTAPTATMEAPGREPRLPAASPGVTPAI